MNNFRLPFNMLTCANMRQEIHQKQLNDAEVNKSAQM